MEQLWAPWRMAFVERPGGKDEGCIFCSKSQAGDDVANQILYRGRTGFIMLNAFPYTNGHLLIAAYRHGGALKELTGEEKAELMEMTDLGCQALDAAYRPAGYNIGMNLGTVAGAGIPGHLHVHIVPRWPGDTNFMTVLADTRVLPESLAASFERLAGEFATLAEQPDDR